MVYTIGGAERELKESVRSRVKLPYVGLYFIKYKQDYYIKFNNGEKMKSIETYSILLLLLSAFFSIFLFHQEALTKEEVKYYHDRCKQYEGVPENIISENSSKIMQVFCKS